MSLELLTFSVGYSVMNVGNIKTNFNDAAALTRYVTGQVRRHGNTPPPFYSKLRNVLHIAAAPKLRCERRMGEMLKETELNKGGWTERNLKSQGVTASEPKLEDIGISKFQSHRYQMISRLPEEEFEKHNLLELPNSKRAEYNAYYCRGN
jgi:hypothetical protein